MKHPIVSGLSALCLAAGVAATFADGSTDMGFRIESSAFVHDDAIPKIYTCDGNDFSPPLEWSDLPEGAQSLALIVDDPDAPDPAAPRMTWVHWVLYNLPATAGGLPEGVESSSLPEGAAEGLNDWKRTGYGGPCPPIGRHRYFFKLYALDTRFEGLGNPTKAELEAVMEGHVLERVELVGTYRRQR